MNPNVMTLAKWLARNAVKAEWQAKGRRLGDIGEAANAYFLNHQEELIEEAKAHPARR